LDGGGGLSDCLLIFWSTESDASPAAEGCRRCEGGGATEAWSARLAFELLRSRTRGLSICGLAVCAWPPVFFLDAFTFFLELAVGRVGAFGAPLFLLDALRGTFAAPLFLLEALRF
jgi:hypothetical protein